MRILFVVERSLAEAMQPVFEEDGFLDVVHSAEARVPAAEYGAVLLDQSVVKSQCNDYLLSWRRDGLRAHVLVLLPRESTSAERAACLDAGADAYLLHPLSVEGSSRTAMDRDSK
jgi:DNA-binding response OmpR family regulator